MLALALYSAYGTARTDGNGPVTEGNAVAVHVIEKDSEDNLPGAVVKIKETGQAAVTDADGHCLFRNIPDGSYTLTVRLLGYDSLEKKVSVSRDFTADVHFVMTADVTVTDEVVVSANRNETSRRDAPVVVNVLNNKDIREEIHALLDRGGLILGICNGFQALIKLGLVPYGEICGQKEDSPTLTYNTIGRHVSKMVYTKVVSNKSPWLQKAQLGGVYCNPASHGEGRFVANDEWLKKLKENGQIATEYVPVDETGYEGEFNVNGSYMNIEGITSPDGRVLGKMAHSERRDAGVAVNIYGEQDIKIFESGVEYFK